MAIPGGLIVQDVIEILNKWGLLTDTIHQTLMEQIEYTKDISHAIRALIRRQLLTPETLEALLNHANQAIAILDICYDLDHLPFLTPKICRFFLKPPNTSQISGKVFLF